MLTIGITGGIGSGKSTAARILEKYGATVIFADEVAKEVEEPGMPAYEQIVREFGRDILEENGRINRRKLGEIVFSDKNLLEKLNKITHAAVVERLLKIIGDMRREGRKLAVIEAIVPVRHGFLDLVDTVWVILASEPVRIQRVMKRNGMSYNEAKKRIQAQMSDEEYKSLASQVIYNDGTVQELEEKIQELLRYEIDYNPS